MQRRSFFGAVLGTLFTAWGWPREEKSPLWLRDWVRRHHPPAEAVTPAPDAMIAIDQHGVATWVVDPTPPPLGHLLYRVTGNDPYGTLRVTKV